MQGVLNVETHEIKQHEFVIQNMSCASCVKKIESSLLRLSAIESASVNFADKTLTVNGTLEEKAVIRELSLLGYKAELQQKNQVDHNHNTLSLFTTKVLLPGLVGLFILIYGMSYAPVIMPHSINVFWLITGLVTIAIMFFSGGHLYKAAYKSFLQHYATMDTLIALGTLAAWAYSMLIIVLPDIVPENARHVYLEAALIIIALVNLGAFLESKARGKTSEAIKHLIGLQPKTAFRISDDGQDEEIPIDQLVKGDLLRVRPGEKIALDGIVVEGESNIDESMLTGEAIPVKKSKGDGVFSGTINKTGSFIYRVSKIGKDTVLSQIITLVKQAQNTKPSIAKLADTVSSYFVPAVMLFAILTALIWFNLGFSSGFILVASITVLVIACPCALGLATPISIIVGMGKAAQIGVLIKNGEALQKASKIKHIVLDKTGTITKGEPEVVGIECIDDLSSEKILQFAASVEYHSEHPLAQAIVDKANTQQLSLLKVDNFQSHTGLGVTGAIEGQVIAIGNAKMMAQYVRDDARWKNTAKERQLKGQTVMYIAIDHRISGIIAVADPIKSDAKVAINQLVSKQIKITMATGDNHKTAHAIARELGISDVLAEVMPKDKAKYIHSLQLDNTVVAMVGDGINDAPALTQADIGFAIGNGTDIALESADVTLMRSSLLGVVDAILISKATMRNIKQNLFGAFIYNGIGIPIAAGVLFPFFGMLLSPMIAGAAMAASSLTVVMNANRLRFFKAGEK
jgi:Cu+-exporting ATPase